MSITFNKNKNIKKSEIYSERFKENNHIFPQKQNDNKMQPIILSTNIINKKMQNNEATEKN